MSLWEIVKKMKGLDKRIIKAKEEIELIRNEALKNNKFSVFNYDVVNNSLERCEELNSYDKYAFFFDIGKNIEKFNKISIEDGEYINNLMNDKDHLTAIHRTYLGPIDIIDNVPTNEYLQAIMTEGLINNGHAMQGAPEKTPALSLTTTPLSTFGDLMNIFATYKNNNITVLLQFPKELVDKKLGFVKKEYSEEIYNRNNDICYIKPEYILGAIIKGSKQDKFYTREELLKKNKMK